GDDINKGLGNAVKMLNRLVWEATRKVGARLSVFEGGNLRNALAREAHALLTIPEGNEADFRLLVSEMAEQLRFEFRSTEPSLHVELKEAAMPAQLVDEETQRKLLNVLYACAHGVLAMSREIPGFVETSTNLASVKMEDGSFHISTSQRSSVESAKRAAAAKIEATFLLAGAKVKHSDGYPGWTPNPDSRILKVGVDTYRALYGKEPVVRAIHAGLECGLIGQKYPSMDMISYGPTMRGVHSPDERVEIKTVEMFWNLTLAILKNLK
ncbi:MAG: M20/M25/M40 family metallo-hydrolase, partial [Bacteroidales bacterium]|nr:M20/M25/M40 family metallo-hydrolase [Bacteroidales bacterium]